MLSIFLSYQLAGYFLVASIKYSARESRFQASKTILNKEEIPKATHAELLTEEGEENPKVFLPLF